MNDNLLSSYIPHFIQIQSPKTIMPVRSKIKLSILSHIRKHLVPVRIDQFACILRLPPFFLQPVHIPDIFSSEPSGQLIGDKIQP